MFVAIKDDQSGLNVHVDAELENYSPDVMDDLSTRVIKVYRDALATQAACALGIEQAVDEMEGEGGGDE